MEAVLGLLVITAGVSHGSETSCDAREDGSQCYGALGGTVYLQLTDTMAYSHYSFYKGSTGAKTEILKTKVTLVIRDTPIKDRVHFFINNGTFRLNNTQRNDSGEYLLTKYDSEGETTGTIGLQLFIEAPVSSPQLSSECLSHGEMKVSCSSEGDGPQYSWTLDGQTLNDTDAPPDNKTNTITLKKGLSGDLTCTVRNNINRNTVSRRISHCPGLMYVNCTLSNGTKISEWVNATGNTLCVEPTTVTTESHTSKTFTGKGPGHDTLMTSRPSNHTQGLTNSTCTNTTQTLRIFTTKYIGMAAGSLAGVVLVLLMMLAVYCVQKKNKPPSKAQVKGDSQDVEYADVRILRQEMRQKEREAPVEVEYGHVDEACGPQQPVDVEYGQITILEGPRRKVDMPEEEYCMYASVRKGQ
ncbi:uncharacterized protein LOC121846923 isoform X1 [Oncorhynchus tshawytscha]|uniref:uncharacterized protein LOC121846923 isoform X1 n=1 Tax=Oncorhynchus tshawytscha TaxID=74940 RepID=UPI001C3DF821|nr:uncharacterized protein LOC121846923 isoform X1 [Oncorhynchus tshawytscha]